MGALEAAKQAKEQGIRVFVLSIGTEAGGPIPLGNGTYKKDNSGNVVTTKLNTQVGKTTGQSGWGSVYPCRPDEYGPASLGKGD